MHFRMLAQPCALSLEEDADVLAPATKHKGINRAADATMGMQLCVVLARVVFDQHLRRFR